MRKSITTLILLLFTAISCYSQSLQQTTYLQILENLASGLKLELSFSSDQVSLTDSTDFQFNLNADSCILELQEQANLKITKTETHLIIASKAPFYLNLKGKVIDATTGELLPYANILVESAGRGTITNTEGEFDFKIYGRFAGSLVHFSFLGYETQKLEIPNTDNENLLIRMNPKPYLLGDIYVLPQGTQAVDIVKKAVRNIKRNYHRSTIQMEAFYRNTSFSNGKASQLIESALLIEDKGIDNTYSSTKIELQEIRKSTNYLIPQPKKYEIWEKFWGHKNIIHRCYNNNMVRFYREGWWFGPLTEYQDFKYKFEGLVWLDSVKVYKIKYIWNAMLPGGKRVTERENASETGGYFYIGAKDFAILKIEQKTWHNINSPWYRLENNQRSKTPNEICYQKINGKYYLKYITGVTGPNGSVGEFENDNGNREDLIIRTWQWAEEILLVTQIHTDRKQFDKIKYREKLANNENSYRKNYTYNAEFWKNYNVLKENPVEEKFINEIEWEKSLEIQFEENSTNHAQDK